MEKTGRLINILLQIQAHRSITARKLADIFEVSERTIYRDIDALALWGVPIIGEAGQQGGYSLPRGYTIDPSMFTSNQVTMLGMGSTLMQGFTDFIEDPKELEMAKAKLLGVLSDEERWIVGRQMKFIYFDNSRWYKDYAQIDFLKTLKTAVIKNRTVNMEYFDREDPNKLYPIFSLVDIYGLVYKSDTWYAVGYSHISRRIERWNITRIKQVQLTEAEFERPTRFDLTEWWLEEMEAFGKGENRVLLAIEKSVWKRFERFQWKRENRFFDTGSTIVVEMIVDKYEWLIDLIMVNRGDVTILEPSELRDKLARVAGRITDLHTKLSSTIPTEEHIIDFEVLSLNDPRE